MLGIKKIRKFVDRFFKDNYKGGFYGNSSDSDFSNNSFTMKDAIAMYNSGIGRKIVNLKASSAFKEGFSSEDTDLGQQTLGIIEKKLQKELSKAVESMLAFGRGCVLIIDGSDPKTPLKKNINLNTVFFRAFTGTAVSVVGVIQNDITHPNYNKPLTYMINGQEIHHTRIMDFQYRQPTEQDKARYRYGGIGELELIAPEIENEKKISESLPTIVQKMSTFIYRIKGFSDAIIGDNGEKVLDAIDVIEQKRRTSNALVIDADHDTKVENQTVAGLESVANYTLRKIALVTSIPVAWLVGESVKGLNSTGDAEESIFWTSIKNLGLEYVLPILNEKLNYIGLSSVWLNEQYQMTPNEKILQEKGVLENAMMMRDLGLDYQSYIIESGFEVKEESYSENEEDIDVLELEGKD